MRGSGSGLGKAEFNQGGPRPAIVPAVGRDGKAKGARRMASAGGCCAFGFIPRLCRELDRAAPYATGVKGRGCAPLQPGP